MRNLGLGDLALLGAVGGVAYNADAQAYITAVEAADGQALEAAVKDAINAFVVGCKTDGIWNAIKASCILAGARTLAGALVPLVGVAPTRFGTEGGWNYNRKTGLQGNGTNNYLNSNRAHNAGASQNSAHIAVFCSTTLASFTAALGSYSPGTNCSSVLYASSPSSSILQVNSSGSGVSTTASAMTGFAGTSRASSSTIARRIAGSQDSLARPSVTPGSENFFVFSSNESGPISVTSSRLAFYSIGEAIDLALLDARVTTLINALAAAIP